jgi:hypothetical protein
VASGTPVPVCEGRRFASQYGVNLAVKNEFAGLKYLVTRQQDHPPFRNLLR